jgi:hypothetical protein
LISDLEVTAHKLNDIPAINVVKVMTDEAEELNRLLDERAAKLEHIKQLESVHAITAADALTREKQVATEYDAILKGAKAYVEVLRTSVNLTEDERKQLAKVADTLDRTQTSAVQVKDALYTAADVDKDLAAGMTKVGAAAAKAVGQGHGLSGAFHAAGAAFKQFASDFLLKIAEMILQANILKAIQAAEGVAGSGVGGSVGGIGGTVSGLVGLATASHTGGMAGAGVPRQIHAAYFSNAPRLHAGGLPGLSPNEVPAILQRGEEVLARNDARNAMNGGKTSTMQHIQVVNAIDHESVVRQGLQAPSNTKVVLNMIRANRQSIKAALA